MKFTKEHAAKLPDATADAIRKVHDKQIAELQGQARELAAAPGRLIGHQLLIDSAGTYTPTRGTTFAWVWAISGGGGGGGATTGAGAGAGAGGSSGVLLRLTVGLGRAAGSLRGGPFSCGAGGAAGSNAAGNGGNGGNTTFEINGVTYTITGGTGGTGMAGIAGSGNVFPTTPSYTPPAGAIATWGLGDDGVVIGGVAWWSGDGGSSAMGAGGVAVGGLTAGNPGQPYGGGGGGGASGGGGGAAGGAGAAGAIEIWEFS